MRGSDKETENADDNLRQMIDTDRQTAAAPLDGADGEHYDDRSQGVVV